VSAVIVHVASLIRIDNKLHARDIETCPSARLFPGILFHVFFFILRGEAVYRLLFHLVHLLRSRFAVFSPRGQSRSLLEQKLARCYNLCQDCNVLLA